MLVKGSSKFSITPNLVFPLLFLYFYTSHEYPDILNDKIIIILLILFIIVPIVVETVLSKRETISVDSEKIHLNLKKYVGDINFRDINTICLNENANNLTIETNISKHFYKLHGFRREEIQKLLDSIERTKKGHENITRG
jgi:hypothetical protein